MLHRSIADRLDEGPRGVGSGGGRKDAAGQPDAFFETETVTRTRAGRVKAKPTVD